MSYDREHALQEEIKQLLKQEQQPDSNTEKETPKTEVTPQTAQETSVSEVAPEMSDTERQARALGWKTKEERQSEGKDNVHFVEAEEYVRRQPLFERIDRQNQQLRELKDRQKTYEHNLAKTRQEAYDQALRDIEKRQEVAAADANVDEFRRLKIEAQSLNQQMQSDPIIHQREVELPQKDPDVVAWENKNANWYNASSRENLKMVEAAKAVDIYLVKQAKIDQGLDLNDMNAVPRLDKMGHLNAIESEMRRMFPNRFENRQATQNTQTQVQSVGKSTVSTRVDNKNTNLLSRLTPQQRELGERFHRDNPDFTLEKYASELDRMGRLGR